MSSHQVFQLGNRVCGAVELEEGVAAAVQRLEQKVLESSRLALGPPGASELYQRCAPPQPERLIEHGQPARWVGLGAGDGHSLPEAVGVHCGSVDLEHVAPRTGLKRRPFATQ